MSEQPSNKSGNAGSPGARLGLGPLIEKTGQELPPGWFQGLSCPFSRVPDAKPHPVIFVPVDFFDAGMRGGGRALSDG
jgi:hypothetical protein